MKIYLEITSFYGTSLGATHYYGKLKDEDMRRSEEIVGVLTSVDAERLNKKDNVDTFEAGDAKWRFDTEEEIIDIALATYKQHFPEADTLILGRSVYRAPQKILDMPSQETMQRANAIFEAYEKIPLEYKHGFYDYTLANRKKADALTVKWEKVLKEGRKDRMKVGDVVKIYVHGGHYMGEELVSEEYGAVLSVDGDTIWLNNGEGNDPSGPYVNGRYEGPFGFYNIIEKFDGKIPEEEEE